MIKLNNKSQEEIIGFVLIILLVTIIALIFLAINIRKPVERLPSSEIESFLQSSMRVSSACFASPEQEYNIKDLIVSCAETNPICLNSATTCQSLESSLKNVLSQGWAICPDCPTNSYFLNITDETHQILSIKEGNCTGDRIYSQIFLNTYSGKISVNLEICRVIS